MELVHLYNNNNIIKVSLKLVKLFVDICVMISDVVISVKACCTSAMVRSHTTSLHHSSISYFLLRD